MVQWILNILMFLLLAQSAQAGPPQVAPKRVTIGENASSVLTELLPGSGVFAATRHAFQGIPTELLAASFAKAGLRLADYRFYNVENVAGRRDMLVIAPKGSPYLREHSEFPSGCDSAEIGFQQDYKLALPAHLYVDRPKIGDSYRVDLGDGIETGKVDDVDGVIQPHMYLAARSRTKYPGRSNSLVYVNGRLGGIVQCFVFPGIGKTPLERNGGVRAFLVRGLVDASLTAINPEELAGETRKRDDFCDPIDRRNGGGD